MPNHDPPQTQASTATRGARIAVNAKGALTHAVPAAGTVANDRASIESARAENGATLDPARFAPTPEAGRSPRRRPPSKAAR